MVSNCLKWWRKNKNRHKGRIVWITQFSLCSLIFCLPPYYTARNHLPFLIFCTNHAKILLCLSHFHHFHTRKMELLSPKTGTYVAYETSMASLFLWKGNFLYEVLCKDLGPIFGENCRFSNASHCFFFLGKP